MRNKKRNSKPALLLKRIAIAIFICLGLYAGAQTNTQNAMQILNPEWQKDTSNAGNAWRHVSFTLSMQDAGQLKSISIQLLDATGSVTADLGSYELKTHPNGFFYFENDLQDKKSVMSNSVYFSKKTDLATALKTKKIKVSCKAVNGDEKSLVASLTAE